MDTKLLSKGPKSQLINTDFSSVFASYVSEVCNQNLKD